ncbi:hypothetical protein N9045_01110 [bacterium]|nr:hypothetical protein [bacterium]
MTSERDDIRKQIIEARDANDKAHLAVGMNHAGPIITDFEEYVVFQLCPALLDKVEELEQIVNKQDKMRIYTYETNTETLVIAANNSAIANRIAREARPNTTPKLVDSKDIEADGNIVSIIER